MVKYVMIENAVTTDPSTSIKEVAAILWKKHIGSIIITDSKKRVRGIFTERDLIRSVAQGISLETPIQETMTTNVVAINEDASIEEARKLISEHKVRHLPVIDSKGKLIGLFSVRKFIDEFFGFLSTKYC